MNASPWKWWAAEEDFALDNLKKYTFGGSMDGSTISVIDGVSFTFRTTFYPRGAKYDDDAEECRKVGVRLSLAEGPVDQLPQFKLVVKLYRADGRSLSTRLFTKERVTLTKTGLLCRNALSRRVKPYEMGEKGSEFVRFRFELGFPPAAFDALAHLPPPPLRQDLGERFGRWCGGGNGVVTVVGGDGGRPFIVYRDMLTEASDVFQCMLGADMKEGSSGRIHIDELCTDALDELLSFISSGATRASRVRAHAIELLPVAQGYFLPGLKRLCERAVVENMQDETTTTSDLLDLLKAAQTYELRVALNVGLCRLLKDYPQLSAEESARFDSADFAAVREQYVNLEACQARAAVKC